MVYTFLYFAYGSNMLTPQMRKENPSAVKKGSGKLKDYRLDFNSFTKRWVGAVATIVPHPGSETWGAIYEMDVKHRDSLDRQEGVGNNENLPMEVNIVASDGRIRKCRTYRKVANPPICPDITQLPDNCKPSQIYLDIIKLGAIESELPDNYRKFLYTIPDNGYTGRMKGDPPNEYYPLVL